MSVEIVTIQGRGQIVIPKEVRKALSISDGDALAVYATDKVIVMKPFRRPSEEEFSAWLGNERRHRHWRGRLSVLLRRTAPADYRGRGWGKARGLCHAGNRGGI